MQKAKQQFSVILLLAASMLLWQMLSPNAAAQVMALGSQQEDPPPVPEVTSEEPANIVIEVMLTGAAEVPEPGDEDGAGLATLTFDTDENTVCYTIEIEDIDTPTAGHIHEGAVGASGDAVVPLFGGSAGATEGCATSDAETITKILDNPDGYYVNIHNEAFPSGAVRGQLSQNEESSDADETTEENEVVDIPVEEIEAPDPSAETNQPQQATTIVITVTLTGAAEVPSPGDADGTGTAILTADLISHTVCYTLVTENIDTPTAGHIHEGAAGASGDAVIPLFGDSADAAEGCATFSSEIATAILANPAGYYVNIHNAEFPSGAIRGQLVQDDVNMPEEADTPVEEVDNPNPSDETGDMGMSDEEDMDKPEHSTSVVITVTLTGDAEVPDPGDEDGTGTAILTFDTISNTVCYMLETADIDAPTAGHIHEGAAGASGDAVVPLFGDGADAAEGCATSDSETMKKILDDPTAYYVNIHNEPFPSGAIRGQLPEHDMDMPEDSKDTDMSDEDSKDTDTSDEDSSDTDTPVEDGEDVDMPDEGDETDTSDDDGNETDMPVEEGEDTDTSDEDGSDADTSGEDGEDGEDTDMSDESDDTETPAAENEGTGTPEVAASTVITVTLTGAAEVPEPGDEDGTGTAILTFDTISNTVCYKLETENIDEPTKAHIHEGAEGDSGSSVVTLFSGGENVAEGCVTPESGMTRSTNQEATIIETILANLSDYYVNVHNDAFPDGAIRGQLSLPENAAIIVPDVPTALDLANEPLVEYSIYLPITVR